MQKEIAQEFQRMADFIGMNETSAETRNQERKQDSDNKIRDNSEGEFDLADVIDENSNGIFDLAEIIADLEERVSRLEENNG